MTNMMTFYSVLSISRWSVVTLQSLLKASLQKFYGRHTESVDKSGVSISTGAPGACSRFWRSPSCSFTFSCMCIFFYFICASRCICLRFHCFVFAPWPMSFGFCFNRRYPWYYFHLVTTYAPTVDLEFILHFDGSLYSIDICVNIWHVSCPWFIEHDFLYLCLYMWN
jgi:hypothetical protein